MDLHSAHPHKTPAQLEGLSNLELGHVLEDHRTLLWLIKRDPDAEPIAPEQQELLGCALTESRARGLI